MASADTKTLIEETVRDFQREVPALSNLKLVVGLELRGHGDVQIYRVEPIDDLRNPRYAGIRTFARLPTLEQVGRADVAVLGAPFDGTATFRTGARFGPAAIREASVLLRPYNEPLDVSPFAQAQVAD